MPHIDKNRALNVRELAELMNVSHRHVRSLIAKGVHAWQIEGAGLSSFLCNFLF